MNLLSRGRARLRVCLLVLTVCLAGAAFSAPTASATNFAVLFGGSQGGSDQDASLLWSGAGSPRAQNLSILFGAGYWPHMHKIQGTCPLAQATSSSCPSASRIATLTATFSVQGSILPVVRSGYLALERKRSGELMGYDVVLVLDQNSSYARYVGRRRVEVLKSNKQGDPNANSRLDLGAPPELVRRSGAATSARLTGLAITAQKRWMRLPTTCDGSSTVSAVTMFADGSVETVPRTPSVTGCGSLTVDTPLEAQFNPREVSIGKSRSWQATARIGGHADGELITDPRTIRMKMMGAPKIGEATAVFTTSCTRAEAEAAACPPESRLGEFCVESSPAGEIACGDVWNSGVHQPGSAGGGAGGSVGLLLSLTKFRDGSGGGGAGGLLWVGDGSVRIVPGTGESVLTINDLPQADLHTVRMSGDNPLFEANANCGNNPLYASVTGWNGAARDATGVTAIACSPGIETTDFRDGDKDQDGLADDDLRAADFSVPFELIDRGGGIDPASVSCLHKGWLGKVKGRAEIGDLDRDGMPDVCMVSGSDSGASVLEISAADLDGHVTVLKLGFTIDATPPAIAIDEPGAHIFDGFPTLEYGLVEDHPGSSRCELHREGDDAGIVFSDLCPIVDKPEPYICPSSEDCRGVFVIPHVLEKSGRYRVVITHTDLVGNSASVTYQFELDVDPPVVATTDPGDDDADGDGFADKRFRPAFFDIFFEATDIGSGIDWISNTCAIRMLGGALPGGSVLQSARLVDLDGDGRADVCRIENAPEGDAEVSISVVDGAGHVTVLKLNVTVDTTPPAIAIDEPGVHFAPGAFFDVFTDLGFTIDGLRSGDPGLDGYGCDFHLEGDFDSISRPTSNCAPAGAGGPPALRLQPGLNHARLRVMDAAGNISEAFFDVFYDTVGPVIELTDGGDRDCDDSDGELALTCFRPAFFDIFFSATDDGVGVDWSKAACRGMVVTRPGSVPVHGRFIDDDGDGVPEGCGFDGLEDGEYDVEISVADWRGHVTVLKLHYTVDTTPPAISIDEPGVHFALEPFFDVFTELGFTIDGIRGHRDVGGYRCDFNLDGDFDSISRPTSNCAPASEGGPPALELRPGLNHAQLRVMDAAGNISEAFFDIFYDVEPPHISPDPDEATDQVVPTHSFGIGFEAVHGTFSLSASEPSTICWMFDAHDASLRFDGRVVVFGGRDDTIEFRCEFDNIPDGAYELHVAVTDAAGLEGVYIRPLTVDTVAPVVNFFAPGSEPFDTSRLWPFVVDDANPGSSVCSVLSLDTGEAVGEDEDCDGYADSAGRPCEPDDPIGSDLCRRVFVLPHVLESDGRYRATVVHTDLAGHMGSDSVDFTIDTTVPEITLTDGRDDDCDGIGDEIALTCFRPAFFDVFYTATDAGVGVDWSTNTCAVRMIGGALPGGAVLEAAQVVDTDGDGTPDACRIENAPDGDVEVEISVADHRGHVTVLKLGFTVDATGPEVTFTGPADADSDGDGIADDPYRHAEFDVPLSLDDAGGSGVDPDRSSCTLVPGAGVVSAAVSGLVDSDGDGSIDSCHVKNASDGLHYLLIVAWDEFGNPGPPARRAWVVDTVRPQLVTSSTADADSDGDGMADDPLRSESLDVLLEVSDAGSGIAPEGPVCDVTARKIGLPKIRAKIAMESTGKARLSATVPESGTYDVECSVSDGAGHVTVLKVGFIVDADPPVVVASSGATQYTQLSDHEIKFEVDEQNLRLVRCGVATGAGAAAGAARCSGGGVDDDCDLIGDLDGDSLLDVVCSVAGLSEGSNGFDVVATDAVGHQAQAHFDVVSDTIAPVIRTTDSRDNDSDGDGFADDRFRGEVIEVVGETIDYALAPTDGITCELEGPAGLAVRGKVKVIRDMGNGFTCLAEELEEADVFVVMTATDAAGHVTVLKLGFTVDTTSPAIAIDEPGVHFALEPFFDVFSELGFSIDGMRPGDPDLNPYRCDFHLEGDFDSISRPTSNCAPAGDGGPPALPLRSGLNRVVLRAMDPAGHVSASFFDVFYDDEAPSIAIDEPGAHITGDPDFDLLFTADDNSLDVDGPLSATCGRKGWDGWIAGNAKLTKADAGRALAGECSFTGVTDGVYEVELTVFDASGHVTVLKHSVTVDTTPPVISSLSPSDGEWIACPATDDPTVTGVVPVKFTLSDGSEDLASVEVSFNGGPRQTVSLDDPRPGTLEMTVDCRELTTGMDVEYRVYATDRAGNKDDTAATVLVDKSPPVVTTTDPRDDDSDGDGFAAVRDRVSVEVWYDGIDLGSGIADISCELEGPAGSAIRGRVRIVRDTGSGFACQVEEADDGDLFVIATVSDVSGHVTVLKRGFTLDTTAPVLQTVDRIDDDDDGDGVADSPERLANFDLWFDTYDAGIGVDDSSVTCSAQDLKGIPLPRHTAKIARESHGRYGCNIENAPPGPAVVVVSVADSLGHVTVLKLGVVVVEPAIELTNPADIDADGDGEADDPLRPSSFDVAFKIVNDLDGSVARNVSCVIVRGWDPATKQAMAVVDTDGDGVPDVCRVDGASSGKWKIEISGVPVSSSTKLATVDVTVDADPPQVEFFAPGSEPFGTWPILRFRADDANPGQTRCILSTDDPTAPAIEWPCDGYVDAAGQVCDPVDPTVTDCERAFFSGQPTLPEPTGRYFLRATHTDQVGNTSSATFTYQTDRPPSIEFVDPPSSSPDLAPDYRFLIADGDPNGVTNCFVLPEVDDEVIVAFSCGGVWTGSSCDCRAQVPQPLVDGTTYRLRVEHRTQSGRVARADHMFRIETASPAA